MNLVRRARLLPTRGMGGAPFDAAGKGRRGLAWVSTKLGTNTLLLSDGAELISRSRDAVRNNSWAWTAVDSYQANVIGRGIRLVPQQDDAMVRERIQAKWNRWVKECDAEYEPANPCSGQLDFYGFQGLSVRDVMTAGEAFVRFIPRPRSEGLSVPLQIELIASEQLPLWRMSPEGIDSGNAVRMGIEFRPDKRRAAYHFWKAHPGETMFYPLEGLQTERVPATEVLHVFKPISIGQMRGMPWLTSVLAKLYELDQLVDAEIVRRKVGAMITGFIRQITPGNPVMPADPASSSAATDPGTQISKLEPGTFPVLNQGEDITFPTIPASGDLPPVVRMLLQAFAGGANLTYEQISGDLSGVNFSSIRTGMLEMRRKAEQFQHGIFIHQFCHPIFRRWLKEAMLAMVFGAEMMVAYQRDPAPFEKVAWVTPGWPWIDPLKDIAAAERTVRGGFGSRSRVCASLGVDSQQIDKEQQADNARADEMGLVYDSDGREGATQSGMDAQNSETGKE
jgi:lambda family phage portal protein